MSRDNEPPRTLVTYKDASGDPVWGQFAWVTDLDFFEDSDTPTKVIEERWALVSRKTFWVPDCGICDQCETADVPWPADFDGSSTLVRCKACIEVYGTVADNPYPEAQ